MALRVPQRVILTRRPWRGLLALAGALALAGCATHAGGGAKAAHDLGAGLRLSPDPASAGSRIAVNFDDARMQTADCRFEWRRNGSVISGAITNVLDPSRFSKHDEIAVTVSLPDLASGMPRTLSARVRVENTPPKLTGASLVTASASGVPELRANVQCADPDADVPSYTYSWFKNGGPIDNATGPSLPLSGFAKGDRVAVEVVARDEESASTPLRSEPFAVENLPPSFSSQPGAPKPGDVAFQYHAAATDPDGDPLRYELISGPEGMSVDAAGNVVWPLPVGERRHGVFQVRIRATDPKGGGATQDFTIRIDPPPAKS